MKILLTVISLFFFSLVYSSDINFLAYTHKDSTDTVKKESKDTTQQLNFESDVKLDPEFYKERYQEKDLMYKITDNRGEGFDDLYGTRNLRPILHGVAYRGGANNFYHKENKRNNHNPLPNDGIRNLCKEGFSSSIYLYRENFENAPTIDTCECVNGADNLMDYYQFDYYEKSHIKEMVRLVYESATDENKGPVYLHCWNGWHASGLLAAIMLKQFCGYSDWDAVNYWDLGTDGANTSPRYQRIREMIKDFEPYPEYMLEDEYGNKICAEMPEHIDSSQLHIEIEHLLVVPEAIPVGFDIVLHNTRFGPGKTTIPNPEKNKDLINLIKAMEANPDLTVEIGGYTDNSGSASSNLTYSEKRAKYIHDFLITKGIDPSRLSYKGYGEKKPLLSNRYKSGREGNRRIEVKILSKYEHSEGKLVDEKPKTHYQEVLSFDQFITHIDSIENGSKAVIDSIIFEPYSFEVPERADEQMATLVKTLKQNPEIKIEIQGHTDKSGMEDQNIELSKQRAESVYNYLIAKGISEKQLTFKGYGSSSPIYTNQYKWGRDKNRRIQIKLME